MMSLSKTLSVLDVKFLRAMRITPDDVCPTCHGETCRDCHYTGRVPVTIHQPFCDGEDCTCGATKP